MLLGLLGFLVPYVSLVVLSSCAAAVVVGVGAADHVGRTRRVGIAGRAPGAAEEQA